MNNLDHFIKENIPDDVIWKAKMIELVTKAYQLDRDEEIQDYELRVYGISNTTGLDKDVVNMSDEEWIDLAEQFGYISTLNTFIHNVNKGIIAKDHSNLIFRVISVGYFSKSDEVKKEVDIVPKNKLHYILRFKD